MVPVSDRSHRSRSYLRGNLRNRSVSVRTPATVLEIPTSRRQMVTVASGSIRKRMPSFPATSCDDPSGFTLLRIEPTHSEPRGSAAGAGSAARRVGLLVTARRFAGETIGFVDEVEQCYGVRPDPGRRRRDRRRAAPHRRGAARFGAARRAPHRVARERRRSRRTARRPRSTRSPTTSASAPTGCSACPRANTSTSSS